MDATMTNVVIINDNFELLSEFSAQLRAQSAISVSHISTSLKGFIQAKVPVSIVDILFLDIYSPDQDNMQALPILKELYPAAAIIIFTKCTMPDALFDALANGARGYVLQDTPMADVYNYIQIAKRGGTVISSAMIQHLIRNFAKPTKAVAAQTELSDKENEVLRLLAEGWSYKLIAHKADLTLDGVRYYIKRIYKALAVNSKGEAIYAYFNQPKSFHG